MRPREIDKQDYFFIDDAEFDRLIADDALLDACLQKLFLATFGFEFFVDLFECAKGGQELGRCLFADTTDTRNVV